MIKKARCLSLLGSCGSSGYTGKAGGSTVMTTGSCALLTRRRHPLRGRGCTEAVAATWCECKPRVRVGPRAVIEVSGGGHEGARGIAIRGWFAAVIEYCI